MSSRSLRLSLFDAFFFSIMVGAGESYLPAYALSAGMSETLSGFFSSLPLLGGAFVQLITPWAVSKIKSVKIWVVSTVALQACAFIPLVYFAIHGVPNFLVLFLVTIIYWGAGFAAGPPWNFWMEHLVPKDLTADYFSFRTRINQVGVLVGLVGGGLALHFKITYGPFTTVFSFLFFIAFIARASSTLVLSAKEYRANWYFTGSSRSIGQTFGKFWHNKSYREFFFFIFLFYIAIYASSPFVAPFFIAKLKLNYAEFMLALASLIFAKIIVLQFAPRLTKRFGVKTLFFVGAMGISPLPALWGSYHEFWFVLVLQAVSGAFWALFEMALTLIFFRQIKSHEKIPVLTIYNLYNSTAMILGAMIGGKVLHSLHESMVGYYTIFVIGSALRLTCVFWFERKMRKKREFLL